MIFSKKTLKKAKFDRKKIVQRKLTVKTIATKFDKQILTKNNI